LSIDRIPKSIKKIWHTTKHDSDKLIPVDGINAYDLIGDKVAPKDFAQAREMIQTNYGIEYLNEKFDILFELIAEEGWTDNRFRETLKWFLKNHKYPNWTIADWFNYSVKLYPYSWYLKQPDKTLLESYEVNLPNSKNPIILWKYKDGNVLPFEKI
jgi:hypothetical protein